MSSGLTLRRARVTLPTDQGLVRGTPYADAIIADNPVVYFRLDDPGIHPGAPAHDSMERLDGTYPNPAAALTNLQSQGLPGGPGIGTPPGPGHTAGQTARRPSLLPSGEGHGRYLGSPNTPLPPPRFNRLEIPYDPILPPFTNAAGFSIEFWFRSNFRVVNTSFIANREQGWTATGGGAPNINSTSIGTPPGPMGIFFHIGGSTVSWGIGGQRNLDAPPGADPYYDGRPYHFVYTFTPPNQHRFYVNTLLTTWNGVGGAISNTSNIYLGGGIFADFQEFALYDKVLSPAQVEEHWQQAHEITWVPGGLELAPHRARVGEIQTVPRPARVTISAEQTPGGLVPDGTPYRDAVTATPNLIAYYPLDDPVGSIIRSAIGGPDGTLDRFPPPNDAFHWRQPSLLPNGEGRSLGTTTTRNWRILVPGPAGLGAGEMTIEFWHQPRGFTVWAGFVTAPTAANAENAFRIAQSSASQPLYLAFGGSGASIAPPIPYTYDGTVAYYIAAAISGNQLRINMNGAEQTYQPFTRGTAPSIGGFAIWGRDPSAPDANRGPAGLAQNFALYDRALTFQEMAAHWDAAHASILVPGPPTLTLAPHRAAVTLR